MKTAHRLLSAVALAALSTTAFAATTVYTSSASFLATLAPGAYTETFTGLATYPLGGFNSLGFSYEMASPGGIYVSGDIIGAFVADEFLTITFTSGNVKAVGGNFFNTDAFDAFQSTSVTLLLSDSTSVSFTPTSVNDYRGFVSTVNITSLVMGAPGDSNFASLDNLTVGMVAVVPEPASWLMMGLGVAGLLAARRRQAR